MRTIAEHIARASREARDLVLVRQNMSPII